MNSLARFQVVRIRFAPTGQRLWSLRYELDGVLIEVYRGSWLGAQVRCLIRGVAKWLGTGPITPHMWVRVPPPQPHSPGAPGAPNAPAPLSPECAPGKPLTIPGESREMTAPAMGVASGQRVLPLGE